MPFAVLSTSAGGPLTERSRACQVLTAVMLGLLTTGSQAQTVYRIVGPDGRVTFSDKPPSAASKVKPLETAAKASNDPSASLPFELRQVTGKYPVTLYTSKDCAPCDAGRRLLGQRGVPFAEKTITSADDTDALQRLTGANSLPVLSVGAQQIKGFSEPEWAQYLSAAGYPETSRLPAGYRNPPSTPLVAVKPAEPATAASAAPTARTIPEPTQPPPPRVTPANPAGIQF